MDLVAAADCEGGRVDSSGAARQTTYWSDTLRHGGPLFPASYQPHGVPIIYRGSEMVLPAEAEEAATFYAAIQGVHSPTDPKTFNSNFFHDFRALLPPELAGVIMDFYAIDFSLIKAHHDNQVARRREKRTEHRQRGESLANDRRAQFGTAMVDGYQNQIGNFLVEPPGIFRGRGAHPLAGRLKPRVLPEDVELNLDDGAPIPVPHCTYEDGQAVPMPAHRWKRIHSNRNVSWLACWEDKLTKSMKYIFLAHNSTFSRKLEAERWDRVRKSRPGSFVSHGMGFPAAGFSSFRALTNFVTLRN